MEETTLFNVGVLRQANAKLILKEVRDILLERGYNPINQIAGYLMSGDPGYITSYKNAREKITSIDRTELLALVLEEYLKWDI